MDKKRKKGTGRSLILPEKLETESDYLLSSLNYELRLLETLRRRKEEEKKKETSIIIP
jgi:hypothetical protein